MFTAQQGKYTEAEPLCSLSVEIFEEVFGSNHPDVATALSNKAAVLEAQVRQTNVYGYTFATATRICAHL